MADKAFAVRAEIDTPLAMSGPLHLDALLLEGMFRLTGDPPRIEDLPLTFRHGVPMGSAGVLEVGPRGASNVEYTRIKSIRAGHLTLDDAHWDKSMPTSLRSVGEMSPMRNQLTPYTHMINVRAVWWTGRGDPDAVLEALEEIRGIGAMAATGHGRVVEWSLHERGDDALAGWVGADGIVLRALPEPAWDDVGGTSGRRVEQVRVAPPYWTGDRVPALVPDMSLMVGRRREVETMLAVIDDAY